MEQIVQAQVQVRDLKYLLQKLVDKYDPFQVYRFHRDETSRMIEGCFGEQKNNGHCDYWLLIVTDGKSRIENAVQDFVNAHYSLGKATVIAHGRESIEKSISDGFSFFANVFNTGKLLYNKQFVISTPSASTIDRTIKFETAKAIFQEGISRAEGFLHGAVECFENKKYNVSAFMLHQTVEQCCIALIRYHMDYRCDIHNLNRLLLMCRCFSNVPYDLLNSTDENEKLAFDKLVKSYSNARYGTDFKIEEFEIKLLVFKVEELLKFSAVPLGI